MEPRMNTDEHRWGEVLGILTRAESELSSLSVFIGVHLWFSILP